MTLQCEKCFKNLVECQACHGHAGPGRMTTCSVCNNTGLVCPEHGGFWKR